MYQQTYSVLLQVVKALDYLKTKLNIIHRGLFLCNFPILNLIITTVISNAVVVFSLKHVHIMFSFYVFSEDDINDRKRLEFSKNLLPYFYKFLVGEYVYYFYISFM